MEMSELTKLTEFFQDSNPDNVTVKMFIDMMRDVHNSQREVVELLAAHSNDFKEHCEQDASQMALILNAFPGEDVDGHRRYHQAVIDWLELRNKTIREALIKAGEVGFIAAMGWILYALYIAFLHGGGK
jgi:hypothetical protein